MDPATIIKLITNSTWIVTQLLGDEIVTFEKGEYDLELEENIPLGPILQLRAKVLLQDEPLEFYLKDLESREKKAFQLNSATGELYLVRNIDYEEKKSYVLTVGARVGASTAETTVNIAVVDRNEFPPVFTRRTYETQITEEDDRHLPKPILKVSATDQDRGRWGEIRYILSGEGAAAEGTTSSPSPARSDEKRPKKSSQTQEADRKRLNYGQSFASAIKEAEPQDFVSSFRPSLSEGEGQTTKEGEEGGAEGRRNNGDVKPGEGGSRDGRSQTTKKSYFWVDSVKGDVLLLRPLDRDPPSGRSQWRLKMTATDGEWQTTSDVIINVKDVNDNAPYFSDDPLLASVPENAKKGTFVTRVTASDNDDPNEARNAILFYSLDKNVVDEPSGQPIFEVDNSTGVIVTNLCCLDREKTPSFSLQIVATDGGGLKGTGTVSIEVSDENDVGPKFSRDNWVLKVTEEEDLASSIGSISVVDPDVTNHFAYRITSGDENKQFYIKGKADGSGALIFSRTKLDYEDSKQREGFRFGVEVTDLGPNGWSNKNHTAGSWVTLILQNKNDNEPKFKNSHIQISLSENSPSGASVASFRASDGDYGDESKISYSIGITSISKEKLFRIDQNGVVILSKHLDRETTTHHKLEILATDSGVPPKTATGTLEIEVTDVNDSPPKLSSVHHFHVVENSVPQVIGRVHLDDPDDWTLGHGPPFKMVIDPRGNRNILNKVSVSFDAEAKEGHGEGIIRTLVPLDREMDKTLHLPLIVTDGGFPRQSATVTVTITVADVNDNPMSPASKHVIVHAMQPVSSNVPLGRVYVKDPDDWDSSEKKYSWSRSHPLFILNATTGDLFMKPDARPGRYELEFFVSDEKHGQSKVESNISVQVNSLTNVDIKTTNSLVIHMDPFHLVHRVEGRPSYLELILETIQHWLSEAVSSDTELQNSRTSKVEVIAIQKIREDSRTKSSLWIHTPHYSALQNFLLIQKVEFLEKLIGAPIEEVGTSGCLEELQCGGRGCWSKIQIRNNFTLIDANETSIVGPELRLISGCGCQPSEAIPEINGTAFINDDRDTHLATDGNVTLRKHSKESNITNNNAAVPKTDTLINSEQREHFSRSDTKHVCVYNPCLNGGKCLPTSSIGYRCICPHGTIGKFCKILSRHFEGSSKVSENGSKYLSSIGSIEGANQGSWSWLPPMPTCSNIHISLEVQTLQKNALLLYTGLQIPRNIVSPSDTSLRSKFRSNFHFLPSNNLLLNSKSDDVSVGNSDQLTSSSKSVNKDSALTNKYIVRHNDYRTKRKFRIGDSEKHRTKSIMEKPYLVSRKLYVRENLSQVPFLNELEANGGLRTFEDYAIYNQSFPQMNLDKIEQRSITNGTERRKRRRKIRSQMESADMLILEIHNGRPSVHLNLGHGMVHIYLNESHPINDNNWHIIDILWNKEQLRMFVDLCSHATSSEEGTSLTDSSTNETKTNPEVFHENLPASKIASRETFSPFHSVSSPPRYSSDTSPAKDRSCRGSVRLPGKSRQLNIRGSPLQLGGVSRSLEKSLAYPGFLMESLKGCIKNVRVNRELNDLGHSLLSHRSYPGCKDQQCGDKGLICGIHGQKCSDKECVCDLGWAGLTCNQPITASTFLQQSFATMALSFAPSTATTKIQFRIRSLGIDGEVIRLSSSEGRDSLSLGLIRGHLCFTLKGSGHPNSTQLCLLEVSANDGNWHDVTAERSGVSLSLQVDDGDGSSYNSSFLMYELAPFNISRHDGLHIGGTPVYVDGKMSSITNDFSEGCINDLRLNGRPLPLPPATNETQWAQVTMMKNVKEGCVGVPQCKRYSCRPPFACFDSLNSFYCSCGDGKSLSSDRSTCEDINECKWGPCLNGGACYNTVPGFFCQCQDNFEGTECQILVGKRVDFSSSLGLMVCLASFCVLLFLLICVFLLFKKHQSSFNLNSPKEIGNVSVEEGILPRYIETNQLANSNSPRIIRLPSCLTQNQKFFHSEQRTILPLETVNESCDSSFACQFRPNVTGKKSKTVNFQLTPEEIITLDTLKESPPQFHCSNEDPGNDLLYFARSGLESSLPYSKKLDQT